MVYYVSVHHLVIFLILVDFFLIFLLMVYLFFFLLFYYIILFNWLHFNFIVIILFRIQYVICSDFVGIVSMVALFQSTESQRCEDFELSVMCQSDLTLCFSSTASFSSSLLSLLLFFSPPSLFFLSSFSSLVTATSGPYPPYGGIGWNTTYALF